MRWITLILICAVLSSTLAEPDPKKYKPEPGSKKPNASLTDEEKKFLREVEAKFGIKTDVLSETKKDNEQSKTVSEKTTVKPPFPAVIAIEIVNDTDSKAKNGKRTIDANLGYGYKTDNGYAYSYLGKSGQEKGRFMIYPYSQQDIPPTHSNHYQSQHSSGGAHYSTSSSNVEIQPSKAYELVEMQDEHQSYQYNQPTEQKLNYDSVQGLATPPVYTPQSHQHSQTSTPTTLYTTYNGEQLSGLSGQFPMLMQNYFVNPSQLLKYPQFQGAGLSPDHLRSSGSPDQQKVVPVLVLRIPSSYLQNPSAELYANLPQNYPLSQYLNHVNLQELVNNYFKKIGYNYAPQVMAYQNPLLGDAASTPVTHYEPQHYSAPYIHPSYTQSDYSGVQYSAVKPVMAKYPVSYTPQYYVPAAQPNYQQPAQQYQYTYQGQQAYYIQPQPQAQQVEQEQQHEQVAAQHAHAQDTASQVEYVAQQEAHATPSAPSAEYGTPKVQSEQLHTSVQPVAQQYEAAQAPTQEYGASQEEYVSKQSEAEYPGPTRVSLPVVYTTSPQVLAQYGIPKQNAHQETIAVYPSQTGHIPREYSSQTESQSYYYQKQVTGENENKDLILTENYPSKDHTIATVLPYSYKYTRNAKPKQTVSYVTPMPTKYQSQYRIMVPQMTLRNPNSEKVSYVNSQSVPYSQSSQEQQHEHEYTLPSHFVPPVGRQRPPSYPKNYHSHPKRMTRPQTQIKAESMDKKRSERSEKKRA